MRKNMSNTDFWRNDIPFNNLIKLTLAMFLFAVILIFFVIKPLRHKSNKLIVKIIVKLICFITSEIITAALLCTFCLVFKKEISANGIFELGYCIGIIPSWCIAWYISVGTDDVCSEDKKSMENPENITKVPGVKEKGKLKKTELPVESNAEKECLEEVKENKHMTFEEKLKNDKKAFISTFFSWIINAWKDSEDSKIKRVILIAYGIIFFIPMMMAVITYAVLYGIPFLLIITGRLFSKITKGFSMRLLYLIGAVFFFSLFLIPAVAGTKNAIRITENIIALNTKNQYEAVITKIESSWAPKIRGDFITVEFTEKGQTVKKKLYCSSSTLFDSIKDLYHNEKLSEEKKITVCRVNSRYIIKCTIANNNIETLFWFLVCAVFAAGLGTVVFYFMKEFFDPKWKDIKKEYEESRRNK